MIAKTGINRTEFEITIIPEVMDFLGNLLFLQSPSMRKSSSHSHHDFAMSFFYNKIGIDFWHKCIKSFTSKLTIVNSAFFKRNACFSFLLIIGGTKLITNPIHQFFICIRNFNVGMIVKIVFSGFCSKKSNKEASFSVYDPCKISQFCISHKTPLVNDCTVYNKSELFVQPERLSPWDISNDICDSLNSAYKERWRGEPEEVSPPLQDGHKSNRVPVLNSAAARLGQSLRETQDALQRDNLESSASVINCVGGSNGDIPTEMNISDVDDVFTVLQNNSGEYITNIVEAENRFGTSPIGDAYGCMLTTRMIPTLYNMSGFIKKFQYPNISQTLSVEIGGANNVRFFASEQGSVTPNASLLGNDIANCFVAAKEAYKVVWQAGGKARFIYLPPGYNNDPYLTNTQALADLKSSLIVLNILPDNAEDNKVQASERMAA